MKVIHQSPNQLTLQFHPWFKWMLVSVFNFCAIVCLLAIVAASWDTFDCHRNVSVPSEGQCRLTHHTWISQRQRSWQLQQIKGVTLEHEGFYRGGSPRYRIDLQTTEGIVNLPLVTPYSNRPPSIAEKIRQFLNQSERSSFQAQRDERSYTFFCLKLCLAFAALFAILGQSVTLEINRDSQQLTLRRRNLLGTRTREYPLDQIAKVIVQKKRGGKFGPMGRVAIVLKNGKTIVVHAYDRFDMEGSSHKSAALICHFLGL
jgi:hypothetical protein